MTRCVAPALLLALASGPATNAFAKDRDHEHKEKHDDKHGDKYAYDVAVSVLGFRPLKKWDAPIHGQDEYTVRWNVFTGDGANTFPGAQSFTEVDSGHYKTINLTQTFLNVDPQQTLRFNVTAQEDGGPFDTNTLATMPITSRVIGTSATPVKFKLSNQHYEFWVQYSVVQRKVKKSH
jgi:hypothetical protein